jgi:16S rRNA (uracil1498-N3)-methyltransferase
MKELPLRALPRVFIPGADMTDSFELPSEEADKLRKVLRLKTGDSFAVLPDDGSLWVCQLDGKRAIPQEQEWPDTEPTIALALAQALPKGDRLDTILRMGTEMGVARFILFPAVRSVVKW